MREEDGCFTMVRQPFLVFAMSHAKKAILVAMSAMSLLLAVSCAGWGYHPVFTLSLHEFSDVNGSRLTVGVKDTAHLYSREVMKYGFLTSRDITAAEVYGPAENGKYGLRLTVSVWQANDVRTTACSNSGVLFAVLLDGEYIDCAQFIRETYAGDAFVVEPVFTKYVAEQIASHAERNFEYFSRRHSW